MNRAKEYALKVWPYLIIAFCLLLAFVPLTWIILSSFKPAGDILTIPPFYFPKEYTLQHYYDIFLKQGISRVFLNSLTVAFIPMMVSLILGTMAAYTFARSRKKAFKPLLAAILAGRMMPAIALVVPLYVVLRQLGLLDSKLGLMIAYTAICMPFTIYMMIGFISQVPYEIEESGFIDGCSTTKGLIRLVLPLIGPGLAATAVFSFLTCWNEYLFAVIFLIKDTQKTVPIALMAYDTGRNTYWGPRFAVMAISLIPATCFTLFAQKYLVAGVTLGAVKG
jgi:ABC-type glycerol-3-phosphate transport system permease component